MARYTYEARYSDPSFGVLVLQDVQTISISKGRQQIQDPYKAGTATITGRIIGNLPPFLDIGIKIEIYCTNPSPDVLVFTGTVADIQLNYGMRDTMDTWRIDCEDSFAAFGRALTSSTASWPSGTNSGSVCQIVANTAQLDVTNVFGVFGASLLSGQSVPDTNVLNILQQIIFTEQGRLINLGLVSGVPTLGFVPRSVIGSFPLVGAFSDGTSPTALAVAPYDVIEFSSLADSFYEQVVIEPQGLADQSAGTGRRVYTGKSYDISTGQADNLADYVLATLQVNSAVPQVISANSEAQSNDVALNAFATAGDGTRLRVILRGLEYNVFIEGGTLSATPDQTRFTFNVVSSDALNFFILDSATFGRLDNNKLGF
jgi:hypothetical protein